VSLCQGISDTFDPFLDVTLDISVSQTVQESLECLEKPEEVDGDDAYHVLLV
jgi:ubiquitin carboxyl-terminal hydrolase 17